MLVSLLATTSHGCSDETMKKQELLDIATSHRLKFLSIDASVEFRQSGTAQSEFYPKATSRVRVNFFNGNASKIRVDDSLYTGDEANPGLVLKALERTRVWNGNKDTSIVWSVSASSGLINIDSVRQMRTQTQMQEFFNANLLNDTAENTAGMPSRSVVSILSSTWTSIREAPELVNGRECRVADWMNPVSGEIQISVWIDPERGCVPLKQTLPRMTYESVDIAEITPGIWVVTKAKKTTQLGGDKPVDGEIEVLRHESGALKVDLNSDIDDQVFEPALPDDYQLVENGVLIRMGKDD